MLTISGMSQVCAEAAKEVVVGAFHSRPDIQQALHDFMTWRGKMTRALLLSAFQTHVHLPSWREVTAARASRGH